MLKGICVHDLFCMEVSVKGSTTGNSRQEYLDKKLFLRNIFIHAFVSLRGSNLFRGKSSDKPRGEVTVKSMLLKGFFE